MASDFLTQILGSVLANAGGATAQTPSSAGTLGGLGGLGGMLDSVLGRGGGQREEDAGVAPASGGTAALAAVLLPLAMQWVQRNGGLGAVLERFRQQGYSQQAASWVSTGENQPVDAQAVSEVVGTEELSRLSQQLGVPQDQVADGMAEILPHVVSHLTPEGHVPANADDMLGAGLAAVQKFLGSRGAT